MAVIFMPGLQGALICWASRGPTNGKPLYCRLALHCTNLWAVYSAWAAGLLEHDSNTVTHPLLVPPLKLHSATAQSLMLCYAVEHMNVGHLTAKISSKAAFWFENNMHVLLVAHYSFTTTGS